MSGWKSWGVGEYVEAGDFQTYVQDQVVQVYANSAARGSALGTAVSAGMMSYLEDTSALQVYGTAWANVSSPGDITSVTAGTALSGGGSSGDVTLDVNLAAVNIPAAQINNLGANVATFLTTPSSANLAAAVTGETGTGSLVFGSSPTIATPFLTLSTTQSSTAGRFAYSGSTLRLGTGSGTAIFSDDATLTIPADRVTTPVNTLAAATTAYTVLATDKNDIIYSLGTATCTVTVPDLIAIGDRIDIVRDGAGTVVIAAGTGVTSWAGAGTAGTAVTFKIDQQFNAATVLKVAANTYRVIGRIIP